METKSSAANTAEPQPAAYCQIYGQLSQTGDRFLEVLAGLEKRGIPADIDFDFDFSPDKIEACRRWQARGNLVAPNVYPSYLDPSCTDSNWWNYSEEECLRLLGILRERMAGLGLGKVDALNTYTPGNEFVRAAKRLGFRYLLGFCAPIVSHDTHWKISHTGCPIGPYFVGDEDYRKPECPPSDGGFVISSMELRNPLTCSEHWSEGPFCPLNLLLGDRTVETGEWPIETMAAAEDFIRQGELSGVPRFFHINLQYFSSLKCFDFNERMLDWLADQRRMGRIKFTGLRGHSELLRRSGGVLSQSTWWRGENLGQHCGGRRGDGIEAIISEDATGQWQFRADQAGPERCFDYRKTWQYPPFDPKAELPRSEGYSVQVTVGEIPVAEGVMAVKISADSVNEGGVRRFCVWKIMDGISGPFSIGPVSGGLRCVDVVPHPGGTGLSLVLEADLTAPVSGEVRVLHAGFALNCHSRNWGDLVLAETVWLQGLPLTRVCVTVPYSLRLDILLDSKAPVRTEYILGGTWAHGTLPPGARWSGVLDGSRSVSVIRFRGVTADQLEISPDLLEDLRAQARRRTAELASAGGEHASDGEILRYSRDARLPQWVRAAACRGADREIATVNAIAAGLTANKGGTIVAALHMAADLPLGSKGRAFSAFYDRQKRQGDAELFAIYYDYGQTYRPGVSGWNQFWRINLGARQLRANRNYRIILHTYDPEGRGTMLRITACATDARAERNLSSEVVLRDPFPAVRHFDNRLDPGAFITLSLPAEVRTADAVYIHLYSDSDQAFYDRFTERPGFAFLSHAWLVELG